MHSVSRMFFFFFNDTATTEIYTLSLHDALPIFEQRVGVETQMVRSELRHGARVANLPRVGVDRRRGLADRELDAVAVEYRSEEHTSELQSRQYLVCRLLLEKKKKIYRILYRSIS